MNILKALEAASSSIFLKLVDFRCHTERSEVSGIRTYKRDSYPSTPLRAKEYAGLSLRDALGRFQL